MKKSTLYAKKTLSVFMAVMMLISAWVFVAPTEASAASFSTYSVTLNFNLANCAKGGHIKIYYYPVNSDGTLDKSNTNLYYLFMNSLTQYSTGDNQTFTAGASGDNRPSGDSSKNTGDIPGWPYKIYVETSGSGTIAIRSIKIGNKTVLSTSTQWTVKGGNKNFQAGSTYDGIATNWPEPAVSSVRTTPTAKTINVPKSGSASQTFTAEFNDQYGVKWPTTSGLSASLEGSNTAVGVSVSGNTATVTAKNTGVFSDANYNAGTGKLVRKLSIIQGGVTASCDVTFQSPKFGATLKYYNGSTAKTYDSLGYYNQSVSLTNLPANTAPTKIDGNDSYHQTYVWDASVNQSFNITSDMTFNETTGAQAAHSFPATATQGDKTHSWTCSVCGYVKTQDHKKDAGTITGNDTCTGSGIKTYNCSICGKTAIETESVNDITGHEFSGDVVVKTDGKDGTHYKKCVRFDECGTYGLGTTANDSEAHKWDKNNDGNVDALDGTVTENATCTTPGVRTYYCQTEGCTASYTEEIPATGHKTTATAAKDVTNVCGGDGNAAFWTCSVCNKIYTDAACTTEVSSYTDADNDGIPDVLEVKGPDHDFTSDKSVYVSASAGLDGEHDRQCSRCTARGLVVDGVVTVGAKEAHKYTLMKETPSTCTKQGSKEYKCSDCGQTYTETLPLAAHAMNKIEAVAAKCGEAGNNEYYECETCDKCFKDAEGKTETTATAEKIAALNHTTVTGVTDKLISAATCQSPAVYRNYCMYCGVELDGTHTVGEKDTANGHKFNGDPVDNTNGTHAYKCTVAGCKEIGGGKDCTYTELVEDVASTCQTIGYEIKKCNVCGAEKRFDKAGKDFNNHEGAEEVRFAIAAKCNLDGYTGDTYCLGCNSKIKGGTTITADKTVHPHVDMKDYAKVDSTCQSVGNEAYRYCSGCGTYAVAKTPIAQKAHKFTTYTSNGDGTHTAICATCAEGTEKATDTKDCSGGTANCKEAAICSTCNKAYGEANAANHKTVVTKPKVPATCQTEGTEAYSYCSACDTALETIAKIEMLPHVYNAWISNGNGTHTKTCALCDPEVKAPATVTESCSGGIAYCNEKATCSTCNQPYGEVDETTHKSQGWVLKGEVEATCQAPGYTGDKHYECCDALKEAGSATAQLDHKFTIEVEGSRKAATCIAEGEVTYKCSTCVESEGVTAETSKTVLPIDKKNHASTEIKTVNAKEATCETDGNTGDKLRACCNALVSKGTVIKADGQHKFETILPEYMIDTTAESLQAKAEEPGYDDKVAVRHADGKWYHAKQCSICDEIVYEACFTYEHTYGCSGTDICEICAGLCSLKDPNKHNLTYVEGADATEAAEGVKAYYFCECGKTFLDAAGTKEVDLTADTDGDGIPDALEIPKVSVGCNWSTEYTVTLEPTCVTSGTKEYKCTDEGCEETKVVSIPATGIHTWTDDEGNDNYVITTEPTCGKNGYKAIQCVVCEDALKPNSKLAVDATGLHDYDANGDSKVNRYDAVLTPGENCQKPGTLTYTCVDCGHSYDETDTEGVSAHNWSEWVVVGGDCSTGVSYKRECANCKVVEKKVENSGVHNYVIDKLVPATPTVSGYVIYKCSACGHTSLPEVLEYDGPSADPSVGHVHTFDESKATIKDEATCSSAEIRINTCLECGQRVKYYFGAIDPSKHVWLLQPAEIATCDRAGHNEYYRCVRCLAEDGRENIEATGHIDGDGDGLCDSCSGKFYDSGSVTKTCSCMCHKTGIMGFFYKIARFFWKLFGSNKSCACGNVHY